MSMRIVKQGNSALIELDRPMLDLLRIDEQTPLQVTTDGRRLIIEPVGAPVDSARVNAAMDRIEQNYASMFKRLAE